MDSFEERVGLQRRQIFHQQLLDSQRFGARTGSDAGAPESVPDYVRAGKWRGGVEPDRFLFGVALFLAVIFVVYTVPAAILSAAAALLTTLAVTCAARSGAGEWTVHYGEAFKTTAIGIFSCLTVTMIIGLGVHFLSSGALRYTGLFSLAGERSYSVSMRLAAIAVLHAPGVLACALVISTRIGSPFQGFKGFLWAFLASAAAVPASVGITVWVGASLFGTFL